MYASLRLTRDRPEIVPCVLDLDQFFAVAFGGGDWAEELGQVGGPLSVAFRPVINHFNGRKNVELHIADWRAACQASAAGS